VLGAYSGSELKSTNKSGGLMPKVDVLAMILVQARWVHDIAEGRSFVANEFLRHRPHQSLTDWNSHVGEGWANAYIARAVAVRPDRICFDQAFNEIDNA
jgi:hypothetical protein